MDGTLARGYTRQSLRTFERDYPSALTDVSRQIFPYYEHLQRRGKLTRQQACAVTSVYARHLETQPYRAWLESFSDTGSRISNHFRMGLHCLRMDLARRANGETALIPHADMMRVERGCIEFRCADLPWEISDHAIARLLERGDEMISQVSEGLMPHLLLAGLFAAVPNCQSYPVAVPHRRGLFLGRCETVGEQPGVLSRIMTPRGESDTLFPAAGGERSVVVLATFIGENEMAESQRRLHLRLCDLAERYASVLQADCLEGALYRPLGISLGQGREEDRRRLRAEFEEMRNSTLWKQSVRAPAASARAASLPLPPALKAGQG